LTVADPIHGRTAIGYSASVVETHETVVRQD